MLNWVIGCVVIGKESKVVKTCAGTSALSLQEADRLPEDLFALVLVDGQKRLRKFACHDPAHTEISTFYLTRTYRDLTPEAVKTAARNLIVARDLYRLSAAPQLQKLADLKQA